MRRAAILVALATLAIGCGDNEPSGYQLQPGDPIRTLTHSSQDSMQALGTFTLHFDETLNCLYHDEEDNNGEPGTGGRVVIVWPDGFHAERTEDGAVIIDESGTVVAETGVPFMLGGGAVGPPEAHCDAIGAWVTNDGPLDR